MTTIDNNNLFTLAVDLVNQTNRNIFLTGKAGTGKTTFLRYIKENCLKQTAVVAPTGVAAINAGGSTIHSFFQLPFSPFLPESNAMHHNDANNKHTLLGKIRLNRDRIKVIRQLELLIIDEISMVRCDLLDAIDAVLRHFRYRHAEPFGGVQVLLIGDMYQLPPVTVEQEWKLLSKVYNSPYFFDSRIIQQAAPVYIEFEKIYRQRDDRFIDLLNQVRNNHLSEQGNKMLDDLFKPGFQVNKEDGYIILTTHNYKADAINADELSKLRTSPFAFKANIEGEFNEKAYPADETLQLKEGAQVMFIKNDKEKSKRYYNGKIGTVTSITDEGIFVQCKDETEQIEVQKETWENIRYTVNRSGNQLEEEVIGSFTQYPLRLAWAITIHKSQGLTFEKAVIDAGEAFAAGQVYVALSRCIAMDGIVLKSRITPSSLRTDESIIHFSRNAAAPDRLKDELDRSKKSYQQLILLSLFDLLPILRSFNELKKLVQENTKDFNHEALAWLTAVEDRLIYLQEVAEKFKAHLNHFFSEPVMPEDNTALQNRAGNASTYFSNELADISQQLSAAPVITESKMQAKNFNEAIKDLFVLLAEKKHIIGGCTDGFSVNKFLNRKKNFVVPAFSINVYAAAKEEKSETPHPVLQFRLRELRNRICNQKNMPVYMVANSRSIDEMVMYLPQVPEELVQITGFGKAKVEHYGKQFLEIINDYCNEHGLTSMSHEKQPKKERKPKAATNHKADTKAVTYKLYKSGRSVKEIAEERKLAIQTIEGHLAFYVGKGIIPVDELVQKEKILLIEPYIINITGGGLTPIKEKLGDAVSFSDIRLVIAAKEWERTKETA